MPLWFWLIIAAIVFLISYDKRSGKLQDFFGPDLIESPDGDSRASKGATQSSSDTDEPN
jgi:hypothetical protein